jgi:DNA replication and repair protein RecF
MRLNRLVLENFRSYQAAELLPDRGLTVVAGANGAGKTNLLEGIYVAVTGRSHRAVSDHELVRHGSEFARCRLDLGGPEGRHGARLELVVPGVHGPRGLRKRLTLNGVPRRSSTVTDTVRAVLFRPEEMLLLVGSPSERRRFCDSILGQRDRRSARDLAELSRVLAQRNALLRLIRADEADPHDLAFWDEQLAEAGARVMAARMDLVAELGTRIGPLHDIVAAGEVEAGSLRLVYLDSLKGHALGATDHEQLIDAFRRRIAEVRQKELWNGVSLVGPQRDDLRVELVGRDVAAHASRGQQRTIILALKLAETDLLGDGDAPTPIVLLDDVFSELDAGRSERLLDLLLERG